MKFGRGIFTARNFVLLLEIPQSEIDFQLVIKLPQSHATHHSPHLNSLTHRAKHREFFNFSTVIGSRKMHCRVKFHHHQGLFSVKKHNHQHLLSLNLQK
jgi:hypothetical protein